GTGGCQRAADGDGSGAGLGGTEARWQAAASQVAKQSGAAQDVEGAAVTGLAHGPRGGREGPQGWAVIDGDGVNAAGGGACSILDAHVDVVKRSDGGQGAAEGDHVATHADIQARWCTSDRQGVLTAAAVDHEDTVKA